MQEKKDFWKNLPRPIIALSPMDGVTDSAFRRVCKSVNPNIIVVTEFTSAEGLNHLAPRIVERFWFDPSEQPIIAQLFGGNADSFVASARWLEKQGFAGIDLNMGCPSRQVVRSEQGFALRQNHERAFRIIEAVTQATKLPVSVKTRLGLHNADDLLEFGKGCERAGANMLTIHGRTYDEPYGVPANWDPIYELKQSISIPVLGNGGIVSLTDGVEKLGNLDGFMIGQAAIGNPWVFTPNRSEAAGLGFSEHPAQTFEEKIPLIEQHAAWLVALRGEQYGIREMRKHLLAYVKGLPNAKELRARLVRVNALAEISAILQTIHG